MRILVAAAFGAIAILPSTAASASAPEPPPPSADTKSPNTLRPIPDAPDTTLGDGFRVDSSPDGTIGSEVDQPGRDGTNGPVSFTGTAAAAPCTHRPATYGDYPNVVPPGGAGIPDPASQVSQDIANGTTETGWVRECPGRGEAFYWAPAAIDPIDLVPDALANARTQLAAPLPNINPGAATGGIVNLGMWLAIDDPGTTIARASLAGVWAQVTATVSGITIDLGNGDTVECDGLGTPIPDSARNSLDQGPCGYTYRRSSPNDDPYQLTITTNHTVAWTTSNGASGTLTPIARSVSIDYDVDEIQTIGVSN